MAKKDLRMTTNDARMMTKMIPEMMSKMIPEIRPNDTRMTSDYYHRCVIAALWSARLPQMGDRSYGLGSAVISAVCPPSPDGG